MSQQDASVGVVERLRARRGELVREIFERMRGDAFEHAGEDDAEYLVGLRAAITAGVEYVLDGIERGEHGLGQIPVAVLVQARRAARVGVSLDTVLRRYVVGHSLLEEFIMQEAEHSRLPGERAALRGALQALDSVLDRLLVVITNAYGDELARAERSPTQRRYELVRGLLDGAAIERAELDYELEQWHLAVIVVGGGHGEAGELVRALAGGVGRRLLSVTHGQGSVWAWFGGGERLAAKELDRTAKELDRQIDSAARPAGLGGDGGLLLAVGEPAQGVEGWRLSHRQAQAALLVALRSPRPRGVTHYADVALLASVLRDEMLARSLIEIYLAPLECQRDGGRMLRDTLRAYLAAGRNASSAAVALGVARNTLESRLRTIEQSLTLPLSACLSELEVALRFEELDDLVDRENYTSPLVSL